MKYGNFGNGNKLGESKRPDATKVRFLDYLALCHLAMNIPEGINDLVKEVPEFLDTEECQRVIALAHSHGFHDATINDASGGQLRPDIRNNERVIFDDEALAEELWLKIEPHAKAMRFGSLAVGLNERFRIYRYKPGHFFDWHQDGVFERENRVSSRFTLLIFLNTGFEGGGTSFSAVLSPYIFDDFTLSPQQGKALVFFHPISHRGDVVSAGEKYMLRTDIMYSPAPEAASNP
ncbi:MAG: 2OG-Fe(II) oxygenase [Erythrobacter sp.]